MVASACEDEGRWQEIVGLLVRGLQAGGEARKRAAHRTASVAFRERLTEPDAPQIAQALWSSTYTDSQGLPKETSLYDWAFLLLPQPEPGMAEQRFRRKWLVPDVTSLDEPPSVHDILLQVGKAIGGLRVNQRRLELSEDDVSYLTQAIRKWMDTRIPRNTIPYFERQMRKPIVQAIDGLRSVLNEIKIPEVIATQLYARVKELNESDLPGFVLIAGLVKALPDSYRPEVALLMQTGLASDKENIAVSAVLGLRHWAIISANAPSGIQPPPYELIHEIGIIIANRRKASLDSALQFAKWVFDKGNNEQKDAIRTLALQGLGYLAEDLRYDREDHYPEENVPLLRWRSTQLAQSMSEQGSADASAVSRWLEIAKSDPLPEVRYVKRTDL